MSLPVRWTPEALKDRADIWDYISERNLLAAARIDALFSASAGSPFRTPGNGPHRPDSGHP